MKGFVSQAPGGLSWFLLLPSLGAAPSLSSTKARSSETSAGWDGRTVWCLSVLSQGDGFRFSRAPSLDQDPSLVLAAGPRLNPLPSVKEHLLGTNYG